MIIAGCEAAGVPLTFNPDTKLHYAQSLFEDYDRPLPAESLITESIEKYTKSGDNAGLAEAYRIYALLLSSQAINRWEGFYKKNGFNDKTITFDNRYQKALEYFQKSLTLFENNSMYAEASNVHFHIGRIYSAILNDKGLACENFKMSLQSQAKFKKENPDIKIDLPSGYSSFDEFIEQAKKEADCM